MYNRYIPKESHYTPVRSEDGQGHGPKQHAEQKKTRGDGGNDAAACSAQLQMDKNAGIAGILNALKIDQLDSGDLLLMMIMLLLFLEGDNTELVITLGLLLLLGLGEQQKQES